MLDAMFPHGKSLSCKEAWVGTEPGQCPARLYESRGAEAERIAMYVYEL
jgi:hypothetical protein